MSEAVILTGDCLREMAGMEPDSYDAIVTDPPYGLSFMGKRWDAQVPGPEYWRQMLRVAKPGAHLVAFGGTRTFHRMMVAIEDAGWEIRDTIMWVYGSGFPKSHNVSLSIDKALGHGNRGKAIPTASTYQASDLEMVNKLTSNPVPDYTAKTEEAQKWQGWGTALKPAWEPIILARKPLEGTVAQNVMNWGTGGLNIDGCRIPTDDTRTGSGVRSGNMGWGTGNPNGNVYTNGRWPANLIHDGSEDVVELFPGDVKGQVGMSKTQGKHRFIEGDTETVQKFDYGFTDSGSAARFFYCAKANRKDRDEGLEDFAMVRTGSMQATADGSMLTGSGNERTTKRANTHPTVKPTDLMRYLVRLVARKGAVILDPFAGSGSTGKAAILEDRHFVGIELNDEYAAIARARIAAIMK